MKLISWNVNGFRAVLQKGFSDYFARADADFFCLQEIKMQEGQAEFAPQGYLGYYHCAQRKGYAGTAVFAKKAPQAISFGLGQSHADEGRVITMEYPDFYLVNCYVPNAQPGLARIGYRMAFEDDMRAHLSSLKAHKPVVYCGDLNVAHQEIDIKNAKANIGNPGFSYEERGKMTELLAAGFTDTYRYLYPDKTGAYTWWSYFGNARKNNVGWRIDYFLVSDNARGNIQKAEIYPEVFGSDHCPVGLQIAFVG